MSDIDRRCKCSVSPWRHALFFIRRKHEMAEKIGWEDGAVVTEEDIIAALRPLVDEYFFGETAEKGNVLVYTLPDGRKFSLTAEKMQA